MKEEERSPKKKSKPLWLLFSLLFIFLSWTFAAASNNYPPRVSYLEGLASYEPAGDVDWNEVTLNLPLVMGDRIFSQIDSRVELELGEGNFLRLGGQTDMTFTQLSEGSKGLQLHTGDLILRVSRRRNFSIQTPGGLIRINKKGLYRVSVQPDGTTELVVRKGKAEFEGSRERRTVASGEWVRIEARQGGYISAAYGYYEDQLDIWSDRRDARYVSSRSVAYVGGVHYPGVWELDYYGDWFHYPTYGHVWVPRVSIGWAPFRLGRWGYFSFGWTWISHEPWGWLPYHHGSWIYYGSRWCWVPGRFRSWSPAVVNFYFGNGYVGWAPRPYYYRGGRPNTIINTTIINNYGRRPGLTVVRREDFGRTRTRLDNPVSSREVASSLRSGLPKDLRDTVRANQVRSVAPNRRQNTRSIPLTTRSAVVSRTRASSPAVTRSEPARAGQGYTRPTAPRSTIRPSELPRAEPSRLGPAESRRSSPARSNLRQENPSRSGARSVEPAARPRTPSRSVRPQPREDQPARPRTGSSSRRSFSSTVSTHQVPAREVGPVRTRSSAPAVRSSRVSSSRRSLSPTARPQVSRSSPSVSRSSSRGISQRTFRSSSPSRSIRSAPRTTSRSAPSRSSSRRSSRRPQD